jgi:hypothetical protein
MVACTADPLVRSRPPGRLCRAITVVPYSARCKNEEYENYDRGLHRSTRFVSWHSPLIVVKKVLRCYQRSH